MSVDESGLARVHELEVIEETREIYLGELELSTGAWFVRTLRWLEVESRAAVRVVIDSVGGEETAMFSIHDAIRSTPCPVEVYASGQVCSAGSLILACADHRVVSENVILMFHEGGYQELPTEHRDIRSRQRYFDWAHRRWADLMQRYSGTPADWWLERMREGEQWILGGEEIVAAGLADELAVVWPLGASRLAEKRVLL